MSSIEKLKAAVKDYKDARHGDVASNCPNVVDLQDRHIKIFEALAALDRVVYDLEALEYLEIWQRTQAGESFDSLGGMTK